MNAVINLAKLLREQINNDAVEDGFSANLEVKLATAIAMTLSIPALVETPNADTTYNVNHLNDVRRVLSELNEHFILNLPKVLGLVKSIYATRFNFVHCPTESPELVSTIVNGLAGQDEGVIATPIQAVDLVLLKGPVVEAFHVERD